MGLALSSGKWCSTVLGAFAASKRVSNVLVVAAVVLGPLCFAAAPDPASAVAPVLNPEKEGQELAARLRSATPSENSEFRGTLIIRQRGVETNLVPIRSAITVGRTNWQVTYETSSTGAIHAEKLVIIHTPSQTNEYLFTRAGAATNFFLPPQPVPVDKTGVPFAGSDFWLCDLGLEFLHWPEQRLLKHQMTRGRSCRVLESLNPRPGTNRYVRVVSWIDVETDGILRAEAYDASKTLLKEFFVGPVKKVNGQWQLQDMKMVSPKARRETELRFDLK